jgi:hypothetical protein
MTDEKNATPEQESGDEFLSEVTDELIEAPVTETEKSEADGPKTEVTDNDDDSADANQSGNEREKLPDAVQEKIDKRIAKITAKSKQRETALEAELEEARSKVEELRESDKSSNQETPVVSGDIKAMTADDLSKMDQAAREFIVWANKGPLEEGFEGTDEEGETKYYSPEEIKEQYNYYQEKVLIEIPQAREGKAKLARQLDNLAQINPALQDDSSEEFRVFREIYTDPSFQAVKAGHPDPVGTAWMMTLGKLNSPREKDPFVPSQDPGPPPQVPVQPAPARPSPIGTVGKEIQELSEDDFERAAYGDVEGAVAKLLT